MTDIASLSDHEARVFRGQHRQKRVVQLGVGVVVFGGVSAFLWATLYDPDGSFVANLLPIVFTGAVLVIAVGFVRAVRNLRAPIVAVALVPKRFRQGDPVTLRWEAPPGAGVERLRVTAVEMRVVPSSEGDRRVAGREFGVLDVRGAEAERGASEVEFPEAPERSRKPRERVEFDLRVDAGTMRGVSASDTYVLGAIEER